MRQTDRHTHHNTYNGQHTDTIYL